MHVSYSKGAPVLQLVEALSEALKETDPQCRIFIRGYASGVLYRVDDLVPIYLPDGRRVVALTMAPPEEAEHPAR